MILPMSVWIAIGVVIGLLISHFIKDRPIATLTVDPDEKTIVAFEIDVPIEKLITIGDFKIKVKMTNKKDTAYNAGEENHSQKGGM